MRPIALGLLVLRCTPHTVWPTPPLHERDDPRNQVTEWRQVHRFHCARGADGAPLRCTRDSECGEERVCDTLAGCGCCVTPAPTLDADSTLRRYVFTGCVEGRCALPRYCETQSDGRSCLSRFEREVPLWMTTYQAPAGTSMLVETRRALCIRVEASEQRCMWKAEAPARTFTIDAPMPRRVEGSYECGGRTCNGHAAVRASPRVGSSLTMHLVVDGCSLSAP